MDTRPDPLAEALRDFMVPVGAPWTEAERQSREDELGAFLDARLAGIRATWVARR